MGMFDQCKSVFVFSLFSVVLLCAIFSPFVILSFVNLFSPLFSSFEAFPDTLNHINKQTILHKYSSAFILLLNNSFSYLDVFATVALSSPSLFYLPQYFSTENHANLQNLAFRIHAVCKNQPFLSCGFANNGDLITIRTLQNSTSQRKIFLSNSSHGFLYSSVFTVEAGILEFPVVNISSWGKSVLDLPSRGWVVGLSNQTANDTWKSVEISPTSSGVLSCTVSRRMRNTTHWNDGISVIWIALQDIDNLIRNVSSEFAAFFVNANNGFLIATSVGQSVGPNLQRTSPLDIPHPVVKSAANEFFSLTSGYTKRRIVGEKQLFHYYESVGLIELFFSFHVVSNLEFFAVLVSTEYIINPLIQAIIVILCALLLFLFNIVLSISFFHFLLGIPLKRVSTALFQARDHQNNKSIELRSYTPKGSFLKEMNAIENCAAKVLNEISTAKAFVFQRDVQKYIQNSSQDLCSHVEDCFCFVVISFFYRESGSGIEKFFKTFFKFLSSVGIGSIVEFFPTRMVILYESEKEMIQFCFLLYSFIEECNKDENGTVAFLSHVTKAFAFLGLIGSKDWKESCFKSPEIKFVNEISIAYKTIIEKEKCFKSLLITTSGFLSFLEKKEFDLISCFPLSVGKQIGELTSLEIMHFNQKRFDNCMPVLSLVNEASVSLMCGELQDAGEKFRSALPNLTGIEKEIVERFLQFIKLLQTCEKNIFEVVFSHSEMLLGKINNM